MTMLYFFLLCSIGLMDITVGFERSMACFQDSDQRLANLSCSQGSEIEVMSVAVAFTFGNCSGNMQTICSFHLIDTRHGYYNHVISECNSKSRCLVSSKDVRNSEYTSEFHPCSSSNIRERNAVRVDYQCRDIYTTPALSTPSVSVNELSSLQSTTSITNTEGRGSSLPTIVGSVLGAVALLTLIGVLILFTIRKRRKAQSNVNIYTSKSADSLTDEFSYYSAPAVTSASDSHQQGNNPNNPPRDVKSSTCGDPEYALLSPPVVESNHSVVYVNIDKSLSSQPLELATNDLYDECEVTPQCPCISKHAELSGDQVDFVINDIYSRSNVDNDTRELIQ